VWITAVHVFSFGYGGATEAANSPFHYTTPAGT
jgi:hypothetical protein